MTERDINYTVRLIEKYEKLLNTALKLGFSYNSDIVSGLHNERAFLINKIEQESNGDLLCKIWKDGSCHVYDRQKYLARKGFKYTPSGIRRVKPEKAKVKVRFIKEVVVETELPQRLLDNIDKSGFPEWIEAEADKVDNEKSLEYLDWNYAFIGREADVNV